MVRNKVVLAYSGGLDASCILKWLLDQDYEVICYMANIGQEEDFLKAEEKVLKIGASTVVIEDVRSIFVTDFVWPAIQSGRIYDSRYLFGTCLALPYISVSLVKCARQNGAEFIFHGATGKKMIKSDFNYHAIHCGQKLKGLYESPAVHILYAAHTDPELFCLDKEVYRIRQLLTSRLLDYVYSGFWFGPEGGCSRKCIELAENSVNGRVKLEIYKGNANILGRWSSVPLFNVDLVSMDIYSTFTSGMKHSGNTIKGIQTF